MNPCSVVGLSLLLLGCLAGCSEPPNLLLITLDTTRADFIGCYGKNQVLTPRIDALAHEGTLFTRAIAPSQCTNPSHASILTGLYLAHHNVYDNETPLSGKARTLAEVLKERGYATLAAVSARHLNPGNSNFGQGFDVFLESEDHQMRAGARNRGLFEELKRIASQEKPFFAWVHYFDPHGTYDPPDPYARLYPREMDHDPILPREYMNIGPLRRAESVDPDEMIALYKGEISYLDAQIGALLDLLSTMNLEERTLVILTADHGESLTEKDIYFCHAGMYNEVLHVPLIMRLPGVIPAGSQALSLVSPVDIFVTALEILGVGATADLDGKDLTPAFLDPDARIHEYVVSEAVKGVIRVLHSGDMKYVRPDGAEWSMPEDHLYRPFTDYDERIDLKEVQSEVAARMAGFLDRWIEEARGEALPRETPGPVDAKTRESLKALGYVD